MGKNDKAETKAAAPKKERVRRTEAERIADLEAQLAAARNKAEAKVNKERDTAHAKRAKLVERIAGLQQQVDAIDTQFGVPAAPKDAES